MVKTIAEPDKYEVVMLKRLGMKHQEVINYLALRDVEISKGEISKIMKVWRETGTVSSGKRRPGRPRKLSDTDSRYFYLTSLRNRRLTAKDLANMPEVNVKNVCCQTISKALDRKGLKSRVALRKPRMTSEHRRRRLEFCRAFEQVPVREWRRVGFSDEAKIYCSKQGKIRIRRRVNEFGPIFEETDQYHGGIEMMVWGYITPEGPAHVVELLPSINSEDYVGLLAEFLNYREFTDGTLHYFQDSASIHTTPLVSQWAQNTGVPITTLPSKSPDLNIIENIWSHIKAELGLVSYKIKNRNDLWVETERIFRTMSQLYIDGLYESMPRRVREVIRRNGGPTKY